MALQSVHDKIDDIPEQYRDLYTEKSGKFELTGITGVKTQADVDRVQTALSKERDDHKTTKEKATIWGDMDHAETVAKLDRFPELEAAAAGKIDEAAIEEIVNRRVEGTINSKIAPLERQVTTLTKERDDALGSVTTLSGEKRTRSIHDAVRSELVKSKVIGDAHEDALMLADRVFEIREDDGVIVTKDNVGVTPGITPDQWLAEMQERRAHWWPGSQGGGASGGKPGGGSGFSNNPFTRDNWNMTKQGEVVRSQGMDKASQMAKAAGTTVGGQMPAARK